MAGTVVICFTDSAEARGAMTACGMPGWLARLDLLDAGDLEPWKLINP
jgi:hypothetical protein